MTEDWFKLWLSMAALDQPIRSRLLPGLGRAGYWRHVGARPQFSGVRIGRGAGVGRVLAASKGKTQNHTRSVATDTRVVRLQRSHPSGSVRDHLRYLTRSREGEERRLTLYGPDSEPPDPAIFAHACQGDRHQFRTVVGAEDACEYEDLQPLVKRLMAQVARDLRTPLDWVAVDHHDTRNPHSHIVIRGVDERGDDLLIAREYIQHGIQQRAAELVTLDLGPRLEGEPSLSKNHLLEIQQESATRIDRELVAERDSQGRVWLDHSDRWEQAARAGRLRILETLGLAHPDAEGAWYLQPDLVERLEEIAWRNRMGIERCYGREIQNGSPLIRSEMPGPADEGEDGFRRYRVSPDIDAVLYLRHLDASDERDLNVSGRASLPRYRDEALSSLPSRELARTPIEVAAQGFDHAS